MDRAKSAQKSPAYLKLNPNGLIPVLVDGPLVLYETAAICLHLADANPKAGLVPAAGTAERAHCYKWLAWMTNTLQAALIIYFYPERWMNEGNAAGAAELKGQAEAKIGAMLDQLDAQFAAHGGDWMLGRALQRARSLRPRPVPLDARLCAPGAQPAALEAVPRAHARAPGRAARPRQREARRALRLRRVFSSGSLPAGRARGA